MLRYLPCALAPPLSPTPLTPPTHPHHTCAPAGLLLSIAPRLLWFLLCYAALGTAVTAAGFGRRLMSLTYSLLQREADLRFALVRVRENAGKKPKWRVRWMQLGWYVEGGGRGPQAEGRKFGVSTSICGLALITKQAIALPAKQCGLLYGNHLPPEVHSFLQHIADMHTLSAMPPALPPPSLGRVHCFLCRGPPRGRGGMRPPGSGNSHRQGAAVVGGVAGCLDQRLRCVPGCVTAPACCPETPLP